MNQFGFIPQYQPMMQRQEVMRVNGENGARMISIAPNSSVLALDENEPVVWFCQTDGAGYKTVTPYKIIPVKQEQTASINELAARIERLESVLNGKSNTGTNGIDQDEECRIYHGHDKGQKPTSGDRDDLLI